MSFCEPEPQLYESMILCPDTDAGYQALHEAVQEGWEPLVIWNTVGVNHIVMRKKIDNG